MTHIELLIEWFKARGGSATLREILTSGQPFAYEWRARATNMRQSTQYDLILERGKKASDNLYRLVDRKLAPVKIVEAPDGQLEMRVE